MIHTSSIPSTTFGSRPVALPDDSGIVSEGLTFEQEGDNYMYYDVRTATGKPNAYQKLLSEAKKSIKIWDPYFDPDNCAQLFVNVKTDGLRIEILSAYDRTRMQGKAEMEKLLNNIQSELNKSIQTCRITAYMYQKANWHDRFLIIDEGEDSQVVYLIGASMDGHVSTEKSHGICKINDSGDAALIIKKYKACLRSAPNDQNHKMSRNLPITR